MGLKQNFFRDLFGKVNISKKGSGYAIELSFERFGKKLDRAQDAMKQQLVTEMLKYVPEGDSHQLIQDIQTFNETNGERDVVYAYNPHGVEYGHYQWEGVMYADPITGKGAFYSPEHGFWSRPKEKGGTKVRTTRLLAYTKPEAHRGWLRYAAEHDRDKVVAAAKRGFSE